MKISNTQVLTAKLVGIKITANISFFMIKNFMNAYREGKNPGYI